MLPIRSCFWFWRIQRAEYLWQLPVKLWAFRKQKQKQTCWPMEGINVFCHKSFLKDILRSANRDRHFAWWLRHWLAKLTFQVLMPGFYSQLSSQFQLPTRHTQDGQPFGLRRSCPGQPCRRSGLSSQVLALALSSGSQHGHLEDEPMDESSLSLCFFNKEIKIFIFFF